MNALRCATMLLPLALLLVACGGSSRVWRSATPLDDATLVERLRADGATIAHAEDASAYPPVTPTGRMLHMNDMRI